VFRLSWRMVLLAGPNINLEWERRTTLSRAAIRAAPCGRPCRLQPPARSPPPSRIGWHGQPGCSAGQRPWPGGVCTLRLDQRGGHPHLAEVQAVHVDRLLQVQSAHAGVRQRQCVASPRRPVLMDSARSGPERQLPASRTRAATSWRDRAARPRALALAQLPTRSARRTDSPFGARRSR